MSDLSVPLPAMVWGVIVRRLLSLQCIIAVPLLKQYESFVALGWAMVIGGVTLSFIHPPWKIHVSSLDLEVYVYIIFAILFGTMLAFWFYMESLQSLSLKETSLLGSLEPLAAVLTTVY